MTFQDSKGRFHSIPTSWTDLRPVDPFVVMAAGRALFRPVDLLAVVALVSIIMAPRQWDTQGVFILLCALLWWEARKWHQE